MQSRIQFMHITTQDCGGVTLAINRMEGEGNIVEYEVGAAFASPRDTFDRKKGRLIAEGRLQAKRHGWLSFVRTEKDKKESITKDEIKEFLPILGCRVRPRKEGQQSPDWYPDFLVAAGAR